MSSHHVELSLPAGTIVEGRYRIVDVIGQGGFAIVYLAEHMSLGKQVALKVLDLTGNAREVESFRERFKREAQLASRLDHPNVVRIYDFGFVDQNQQPYMAMELLSGHDLEEELLRQGPLVPERAMHLFDGALSGLGVAHEHGIVHKDLKPSNLFIVQPGTPQERLVVLDFGIAHLRDDPEGRLTQTGQYTGTPAYAAPEYISDQHTSPAVDVYQMGLIISESLSGTPVVEASTPMAFLIAHCNGMQEIDQRLMVSPIGPVLKRAVSVEPQDRYQDAVALRDALRVIAVESIPNLSGRGYVSPRSVQRSDAPLAHQATLDSLPPGPVEARPDARELATMPAESQRTLFLPLVLGVGLIITIFLLLPLVAGVAYLVFDGDHTPGVSQVKQGTTQYIDAPSQLDGPAVKVNDETLEMLRRAELEKSHPKAWQQYYRRFGHAHQAYHFMVALTEGIIPRYLEIYPAMEAQVDIVRGMMPSDLSTLYPHANAQVIAAINTPGDNEALDSTLRLWRDKLERLATVHHDMETYWHVDETWREDDGKSAGGINKRLVRALDALDGAEEKLLDVLYEQEQSVLKKRVEELEGEKHSAQVDLLHALLAVSDLQRALLDDPHSEESARALKQAKRLHRIARTSAQRVEKPGQQIVMPGEKMHVAAMREHLRQVSDFYAEHEELTEELNARKKEGAQAFNILMTTSQLDHLPASTFVPTYHALFKGYYTHTLQQPVYRAVETMYPNQKQ